MNDNSLITICVVIIFLIVISLILYGLHKMFTYIDALFEEEEPKRQSIKKPEREIPSEYENAIYEKNLNP